MLTLFHHPLCPRSRYVRLIFGEYGIEARLVEERVWERREEFLVLNPAAELPVLVTEGLPPIAGATVIAEFIEETYAAENGKDPLLPLQPGQRVEVRRLASWFNEKFYNEVSGPLANERAFKRHMPAAYAVASVVVSAAVQPEGVQRAILEAQAMARPVIVSDLGAGPDVVLAAPAVPESRVAGFRFQSGDDAALAATLLRLFSMCSMRQRCTAI